MLLLIELLHEPLFFFGLMFQKGSMFCLHLGLLLRQRLMNSLPVHLQFLLCSSQGVQLGDVCLLLGPHLVLVSFQ